MSHSRRHIIITALAPVFAESEIREALPASRLQEIDAILQQSEFSRRDARTLFTAAQEAAFSDD